ncbi:MAG: hypothetical protein MRERV_23c003 [Mycoplasmataceae bacterium RV_VA103A]|nr:MAG: hypothetical protein MRERV_23c003 [Mycoplasmataceae bacterium RV_VA103A]
MTHTYINKNGIPIYAEQKNIQTDLQAQDILKTKTPIPDNFLKLTSKERNYTCSTQGWKEPNCERFVFTYEGEWIQLDIPHTIMKELDLPLEENIPHSVYISPQILERKPICGGITIENKKEIIIDEPFSKDQECQTNLTGQQILNQINQLQQEDQLNQQTILNLQNEVAELENKLSEIEKLKNIWRNKFLEAKGDQNQELQGQITTLVGERDNIRQNLTNLTNKLKKTQKNFLGSIFRSGKKTKEIKDLEISIARLRVQLFDKNTQIENLNIEINQLTTERDDYQTKWDNSIEELQQKEEMIRYYLEQLSLKDNQISDLQDEKGEWEREKEQLNNNLQDKQNEVDELNRVIKKLEDEKKKLKDDLDIEKGWWDKWINDTEKTWWGKQQKSFTSVEYSCYDLFFSVLKRDHSDVKISYSWSGDLSLGRADYKGMFKNLIYEYYKNQN